MAIGSAGTAGGAGAPGGGVAGAVAKRARQPDRQCVRLGGPLVSVAPGGTSRMTGITGAGTATEPGVMIFRQLGRGVGRDRIRLEPWARPGCPETSRSAEEAAGFAAPAVVGRWSVGFCAAANRNAAGTCRSRRQGVGIGGATGFCARSHFQGHSGPQCLRPAAGGLRLRRFGRRFCLLAPRLPVSLPAWPPQLARASVFSARAAGLSLRRIQSVDHHAVTEPHRVQPGARRHRDHRLVGATDDADDVAGAARRSPERRPRRESAG